MTQFKPLLAAKADLAKVRYPVLASPKLDGIRCLVHGGVAVTRSLKPIKNKIIAAALSKPEYEGLDGEIMTYYSGLMEEFNTVQSKVMSADADPGTWTFVVFDDHTGEGGYKYRLAALFNRVEGMPNISVLNHAAVFNRDALNEVVDKHVEQGFEGTMVRDPNGPYKYGRSTVNEGTLLKIKAFEDDEATIVGTVELMRNRNEARTNALGHTERSSHAENKEPANILGALRVKWRDKEFELGTGFTQADREELWRDREQLIGKLVTFKYQQVSHLGVPRFPVFLGMRRDL